MNHHLYTFDGVDDHFLLKSSPDDQLDRHPLLAVMLRTGIAVDLSRETAFEQVHLHDSGGREGMNDVPGDRHDFRHCFTNLLFGDSHNVPVMLRLFRPDQPFRANIPQTPCQRRSGRKPSQIACGAEDRIPADRFPGDDCETPSGPRP